MKDNFIKSTRTYIRTNLNRTQFLLLMPKPESPIKKASLLMLLLAAVLLQTGCHSTSTRTASTLPPGDPENDGLILPEGFEAVVVAEGVGRARHLVVNENGDIYVKLRFNDTMQGKGGTVGLRDNDGDGKADVISYFGEYRDEGSLEYCITIHNGYLYFSTMRNVYRQKLEPGRLVPESELELIMTDDHEHGVTHWHNTKPMAFDNKGNMYVPFGTPSDACQDMDLYGPVGLPGGTGLDPCPEREKHAGIWRFDAERQGQTQDDGYMFATGIRSVLGLTWNPDDEHLYAVVHGIDNFHTMFPDRFTAWEGAMLPAETLLRIEDGDDFGWPYAYYDQIQKKNVLQPGYGGDGKIVDRAAEFTEPLLGFPGHWAPQDLLFYKGDQLPERYRNGAFVVFHGSSDRAPYPQSGYFVAFVPFRDGSPTGDVEVFADGFARVDTVVTPSDAVYRPMGIAEGPDGSIYLSDSRQGRIWRIMFKGDRENFADPQLRDLQQRMQTVSYLKTPDPEEDHLQRGNTLQGGILYNSYCASCHQRDGRGDGNRYPPLRGDHWVDGAQDERLIRIILGGLEEEIIVNGQTFYGMMPGFDNVLDDLAVSSIVTYIKTRFNQARGSVVTPAEVAEIRKRMSGS